MKQKICKTQTYSIKECNPKTINENCWVYTDELGIEVVMQDPKDKFNTLHCRILWSKILSKMSKR
jgi:hypothetical protein